MENVESQATFKEMLLIEADLKAFQASLAQIKSAYQTFIADLGGMAGDVLGVGVFAGIKEELASITKSVNEVLGVSLQMTQEFAEKKDAIEEQAEQKRRARVKESAQQEVQAAEEVAAAKKILLDAGVSPEAFTQLSPTQKSALQINQEQERLINAYVDAIALREQKSKEAFDKEREDAEFTAQAEADAYIKWWDEAVGRREIRDREASARREQQELATEERTQAASQAASERKAEAYAAWWTRSLRLREIKEEEIEQKEQARLQSRADREATQARKDAEAYTAWWQKALADRDQLEERLAEKQRARAIAEMQGMQAAAAERVLGAELSDTKDRERQAQEAADAKHDSFLSTQATHIGRMTVRLIEYYAIWTLIQGVVSTVAALIELPFTVLNDGRKYLDDIQKSADHLTGTMATNIQYSADFVENLKLASEASKQSIMALRDVANSTGLSFDHLEDTFRSLVTAGAASRVNTTRDLVELAQILNIANEQVKGDANLRGLLSDIPKLFQGTLEKGSAFLLVTRFTAQEAKKIADSTKDTHDLLPILTERLAPYLSAAQLASLHNQNIVHSLEEQIKRFEAIMAMPVYDHIAKSLKEILDWVDQNKAKLEAIAKLVGEIGVEFTKVAEVISGESGSFGFLKDIFLSIATSAHAFASELQVSVRLMTHLKELWSESGGLWGDNAKDPKRVKETVAALEQDFKDLSNIEAKTEDYRRRMEKAISAKVAPVGFQGPFSENQNYVYSSGTVLDQPIVGIGDHPSIDKAPRKRFDAGGAFQEEIALIKDYYEEYKDAIRDGVADITISKRNAATQLAALSELEIKDIESAGNRLRAALKAYYQGQIAENKATPEDQEDALSKFDASQINAVRRLKDQVQQADRQGKAEGKKIEETEARDRLAVLKEEASQELSINREKQTQLYQTALQALDAKEAIDQRANTAELRILDAEIAKNAEGTEKRAQLLAQRALLEQRYLGVTAQNALQRISLTDQETDAVRRHQLVLEQTDLQSQQIQAQLTDSVSLTQAAYVDLFNIRDREISSKIKEVQIELQLAQARGKTVESTRQLKEQLAGLTNDRLQNLQASINTIKGSSESSILKQIDTRATISSARSAVILQGVRDSSPEALREFDNQIATLDRMLAQATPSIHNSLESMERKIFGLTFKELESKLNNAADATERFAIGLDVGLKALSNISSIVSTVESGYDKGGVLGGAGAALKEGSSALSLLKGIGLFKNVSKSIPLVGEALGGVLEFIGPLFTKAAERIANEVKKSFQKTMSDFQAGYATMQETLNRLEAERTSAIIGLSGKKGGQDKLNELLPQFDQQIQSLKQQQRQIIDSFNQGLVGLQLQSDVLSQIQSQWTQILKTVQQYLSAGGDATNATVYLSAQLEKMQTDAQHQLDDANQQAIQDAITLNDLLKQRASLNKDFEKQKFDLLNSDSIERRQAGSVSRGQQLKDLEDSHKAQLDALDQQINLTTRKVEMEAKVFDLSMDINDLHRLDEELTLKALDLQIAKWKDLKDLVASIYQTPDGIFTSKNPVFTNNPSVIVNFNGDFVGVSPLDPRDLKQIGDSVKEAVEEAYRNGTSL